MKGNYFFIRDLKEEIKDEMNLVSFMGAVHEPNLEEKN